LPHGDRELPDICANGQGVNAVGLGGWSGTSFAAPAVAGVAALFQSASPTLKHWPKGCHAIFYASASNLNRNTWRNVVSGIGSFEGSGVLHADASVSIAKYRFIGETSSSPRQIGYSVLATRELDNNILTQRWLVATKYYAPSSFYRNDFSIRVTMAWSNPPDTEWEKAQSYGLHASFDLLIRNRHSRQIAASS
jgi:subtilisin family serine protease